MGHDRFMCGGAGASMRGSRRLWAAVLVAGIALAIPATAAADRFDPTRPQVISLEGGSDYPRAVVLGDGTILAQWFKYAEAGAPGRIVACRIPPGGAGCSGPPTIILSDDPQQESALLQPDPDGDPDSVYAVARRTEGTGFVTFARTSSDELPASARRRVAMIPSVPNFDTAKVSVFAVGKDGRVGRPATARLKAVKVKPKKKKTP